MEKITGNKLIAEFMGYKRNNQSALNIVAYGRKKHWQIEPFGYYDDIDLQYRSSWDWLKPVIDELFTYAIAYPYIIKPIREMKIVVEISAAWERVVECIELLNREKNRTK